MTGVEITVAYALAAVGMTVGGYFALRLAAATDWRGGAPYLLVIPGAAAVSYAVMATGFGRVAVGGESILVPRYVDWLVTTPVLVGFVAYLAGAPRRLIAGVAAADALMILTGAVATVTVPPTKWVFFAVSGAMHLTLLVGLYGLLPRYLSPGDDRWRLFKLLQNHVGLLWLVYPVAWVVSSSGLGYVSVTGVALVVAYLDVIAKTPYVYFVYQSRHVLDADGGTETGAEGGADRERERDAPTAVAGD